MSAYTIPETINEQTLREAGFERGQQMGQDALDESLAFMFDDLRLELEKQEAALAGEAGKRSLEAFKGALDAADERMPATRLFDLLEKSALAHEQEVREYYPAFQPVKDAINKAADDRFRATGEEGGRELWQAYEEGIQAGVSSMVYRFTEGDPDQGEAPFVTTTKARKAVSDFLSSIAELVDDRGLGEHADAIWDEMEEKWDGPTGEIGGYYFLFRDIASPSANPSMEP